MFKVYRLGDIATLINGRAYLMPEMLKNGKYRIVRVGNFTGKDEWYFSDMELSEEKYCKKDDLLYKWACTFGPELWQGEKSIFHYHIWKIIPNANIIDKHYLYYLLRQMTSSWLKKTNGSTMVHITKETMENNIVSIPKLEIQKQIAGLLRNIDSKIETNNAIISELEAMAKTLYDYWFLQFDFPDENGKPYKSSGGKMVWNEELKREIPEGWEVVTLKQYIRVGNEKISPKDIGNRVYVPIEVIPRNKISFSETASIDKALSGLCAFSKKAILLSNRRVYFHKVVISPFDGVTRDTVIIIYPQIANTLGYVFELVNSDHFIEYATKNSYGTEQPVLATPTVLEYKVLKPLNNLDNKYSSLVNSSIDRILELEKENQELASLRDFLLPMLMNGQVTFKEEK